MKRLIAPAAGLVIAVLAIAPSVNAGEVPRLEGQWILLVSQDFGAEISDLHRIRPGGGGLSDLTQGAGRDTIGAISPDGTAIAFSTTVDGITGIWLMDVDGGNRRALTEGYGADPAWTPDGLAVVYSSFGGIRVVGRNGADDRVIVELEGANRNPVVSPDGTTVTFDNQVESTRDVFSVPLAGGEATPLTTEGGFEARWSPDGSRIVFVTFRPHEGDGNIWVMNPDGSAQANLVTSPNNDFRPSWSPDATRVLYESVLAEGGIAILIRDLATGTDTELLADPEGRWRDPVWNVVTLDPIEVTPTTTTEATSATEGTSTTESPSTGTDSSTTEVPATTVGEAAPPSGNSSDSPLLLVLVVGMLVILAFGGGILLGRNLDSSGREPPPPPPV